MVLFWGYCLSEPSISFSGNTTKFFNLNTFLKNLHKDVPVNIKSALWLMGFLRVSRCLLWETNSEFIFSRLCIPGVHTPVSPDSRETRIPNITVQLRRGDDLLGQSAGPANLTTQTVSLERIESPV